MSKQRFRSGFDIYDLLATMILWGVGATVAVLLLNALSHWLEALMKH